MYPDLITLKFKFVGERSLTLLTYGLDRYFTSRDIEPHVILLNNNPIWNLEGEGESVSWNTSTCPH